MKKTKSTDMLSFLEEGVRRYADALDTLSAFELEIGHLLDAAIPSWSSKQWAPLKTIPKISKAKAGCGVNGSWISIGISGKAVGLGETKIDCGLWWKVPSKEIQTPIIYASYDQKPKRLTAFPWRSGHQGIQSIVLWHRTFLYVPLNKPQDIGGAIGGLLRGLLNQLK